MCALPFRRNGLQDVKTSIEHSSVSSCYKLDMWVARLNSRVINKKLSKKRTTHSINGLFLDCYTQ